MTKTTALKDYIYTEFVPVHHKTKELTGTYL